MTKKKQPNKEKQVTGQDIDLNSLSMEDTIAFFLKRGAKLVQKTGGILMPLSKEQGKAMKKRNKRG